MIPIPKQRRVGRFIGGMKELMARTTFYVSILNFSMLAVTTYYTTIRHIISIPFWAFVIVLAIVLVSAMVFEYTIVLPSHISFINWQLYTHDNPIRKDLEKIMERLDKLEKMLMEKSENM